MRLSLSDSVRFLAMCGLFACAAPPSDPRALFLQAAEAVEGIPRVRYRFEATVSGHEAEQRFDGTALIERLDLSGSNFRGRIEAAVAGAPDAEPTELIAVRQRDDVYLLDSAAALADHASLYAGGSSLLYQVDPALMYAFYDPRSIATEAEAATVVFEGRDTVRGEPCDLLRVSYEDDDEDSRWCLRAQDRLPLLMEWIGSDQTTTLRIHDVEALDRVSDSDFEVEIPPDWEVRQRSVGPPVGSPAEPWQLPTAGGEVLALADLRGEVVVLDFWATWCPPCLETLDNLERLQSRYAGQPVRLIAVNTMEGGDPHAFLAKRDYTFATVFEGDDLHAQIAPGSLPAFAVIDTDGNWAGAGVGYYGEGSERYMTRLIEGALEVAQ